MTGCDNNIHCGEASVTGPQQKGDLYETWARGREGDFQREEGKAWSNMYVENGIKTEYQAARTHLGSWMSGGLLGAVEPRLPIYPEVLVPERYLSLSCKLGRDGKHSESRHDVQQGEPELMALSRSIAEALCIF